MIPILTPERCRINVGNNARRGALDILSTSEKNDKILHRLGGGGGYVNIFDNAGNEISSTRPIFLFQCRKNDDTYIDYITGIYGLHGTCSLYAFGLNWRDGVRPVIFETRNKIGDIEVSSKEEIQEAVQFFNSHSRIYKIISVVNVEK